VTNLELIESYYKENFDKLVIRCRGKVGVDYAEDVVQEAFYRALRYQRSFNPERHEVGAWIARIMGNCVNNMMNERRGHPAMQPYDELEEEEPKELPDERHADILELVTNLCLGRTPGVGLEVWELSVFQQMGPKEISMVLNQPLSTVNWHIKGLRLLISEYMEEWE